MGINKNSSGYTFGFAIVMVVVVGSLLALAAMELKPFQDKNVKLEKMQNILSSINIVTDRDQASELFDKYVVEQVVINHAGKVVEGELAFNVNVKKQFKELRAKAKTADQMLYPMFVCEKDGKKIYVVPMVGTGLWGPIWGFVSLESDLNTIFGANFDHKTETPGLGAEINQTSFESQFSGDYIYKDGIVALEVFKSGGGDATDYGVDGITGGTITSKGVEEMIIRTFGVYQPYFQKSNS